MLRFYGGKKEPCFRNGISQILKKENNEIIPRFYFQLHNRNYTNEVILNLNIYINFNDSFRKVYDFMSLTFVYHESSSVPVYYYYYVLPCSIAATVDWSTTLLWLKKRGKEIIRFLQNHVEIIIIFYLLHIFLAAINYDPVNHANC